VSALLATLIAIPLLYLPGVLIARATAGRFEAADVLERIYERVLVGALLNGWLALTLAELGVFSAWLHLGLLLLLCVAPVFWMARTSQRAAPLGFSALARPAVTGRASLTRARLRAALARNWDALAIALIGLIFLLLAARPFEVVLGVRDAAVYSNAGFAIARTGGIAQHDPIVAEIARDQQSPDLELRDAAAQAETNLLGVQPRVRNIATRLRAAGFMINEGELAAGRVIAQGLHLFPAWIALLTALTDQRGGLFATGLMGLLGVWSVAMLARRLAGAWVGVLAALLLALNGAQVWFSRYSTAETIAQFLAFAGLYSFAAMATTQASASGTSVQPRARFTALLCGLAIGQLALARIDFALVVAPFALYLGYVWLTRRWTSAHTAMAFGLGMLLAHAALHIATLARAYFFDTLFARLQDYALTALIALPFLTPALRDVYLVRPCSPLGIQPCPPVAGMEATTFSGWNYTRIAAEFALVVLLVLALLALRRWAQRPIAAVERRVRQAGPALLAMSAIALGLLAAYTYLVRPQILDRSSLAALPGCLTPGRLRAPQDACLRLQGYVGAPIAAPAYVDPLAAWTGNLLGRLRGRAAPDLATCVALRAHVLPPAANGRTIVELKRDGVISDAAVDVALWRNLEACDLYVLRDLFANSQANLVRVGWYLSPLGLALAALGLVLLWRGMGPAAWPFLAVTLVSMLIFVRLTYGTSDQHYIYILRRYVPVVYPALCLGMAFALVTLAGRGAAPFPSSVPRWRTARRAVAVGLALFLVAFNIATNLKIYTHTEYQGALAQIGAIAGRFQPGDVLLLRGGAPTYGAARDIPDNLATPLTYAFGLNAFTVKSEQPGKYAQQLADYVAHWRAEGRNVYLLIGPSGAIGLPGFTLAPDGDARLRLREFEQPTTQKPTNVQEYALDFQVYRVVPGAPTLAGAIAPDEYAAQVRGFYRAEPIDGQLLAWTNGEALLRIAPPSAGQTLQLDIALAAGKTRPARLGPPRVCVDARLEARPWPEDPDAQPWSTATCVILTPELANYPVRITPGDVPPGVTLLVRIASDTWIPLRDDPEQHDGRRLGVLFGGLTASVVESRGRP
jgi:hypothetical protein